MRELPMTLDYIEIFLDYKVIRWTLNLVFILGLFSLANLVISTAYNVWRHLFRSILNRPLGTLYRSYGITDERHGKTWAVVTGGSDGIGLSICKRLANEGFNICIVARNEDKMKEKIREIKKESTNKELQTYYVVCDLSKLYSFEDYKMKIMKEIEHLEIGMIVLNAGIAPMGPFTL